MLLYVAGKYKGKNEIEKLQNIGLARQTAIELWNSGYTVICPHLNTLDFEYYTSLTNEEFVERDLLIVERCDGIVMLENWRDSNGAIKELEHAKEHDLAIYYWPEKPARS